MQSRLSALLYFIAVTTVLATEIAAAQTPPPSPDKPASPDQTQTPPPETHHAFESSGFKISINGVSSHNNNNSVNVQATITNASKDRQYVIGFGSFKASLDTGLIGVLQDNSGIPFCRGFSTDDDCLHKEIPGRLKDINDFTYMESEQTEVESLTYNFFSDIKGAKTISLSIRMMVRSAPSNLGDTTDADIAKSLGPAHTVNIQLPLIPITTPE